MTRRKFWTQVFPPAAGILLFLAVWQGITIIMDTPKWMLPSPLQIAGEFIATFDRVWEHTESTIRIMLMGFTVGTLFGIFAAVVLHRIPGFRAGFSPFLVLSQNIPMVVLAPLLMIWFGIDLLPKLILITLVCFFPVTVALLDGFSRTDSAMLDYMRMIGASKRQIFYKLEFPHALPSLFSGLKISASYSVMGAVVAEWLGAEKGIGVYMLNARSAFRTDRVFVAMLIIVVLSMLLFGAIVLLEKWTVRWKPKRE